MTNKPPDPQGENYMQETGMPGDHHLHDDPVTISHEAEPDNPAQPVDPNPESSPTTSNMEVHHHTHAGHHQKKWSDYFWEFLMLFLAVFCGFLAE